MRPPYVHQRVPVSPTSDRYPLPSHTVAQTLVSLVPQRFCCSTKLYTAYLFNPIVVWSLSRPQFVCVAPEATTVRMSPPGDAPPCLGGYAGLLINA